MKIHRQSCRVICQLASVIGPALRRVRLATLAPLSWLDVFSMRCLDGGKCVIETPTKPFGNAQLGGGLLESGSLGGVVVCAGFDVLEESLRR